MKTLWFGVAFGFEFQQIYIYRPIDIVIRVFTSGPEDRGSIPGRVIPKIQIMVLDVSLLNTQHYKVQIKGKWSNPGKGVVPSSTLHSSSYWRESPRLQTANLLTYIYIYIYVYIYIYICVCLCVCENIMTGTYVYTYVYI